MNRRTFLKGMSAIGALAGFPSDALADVANDDEFFIFIHAAGGWDVTLWADPRNEMRGIVDPASTDNSDTGHLRGWVDAPLASGTGKTFALVRPSRSNLVFGPSIGALSEMPDRLTIVNGLAMNTVAHPDGATFSATGRHAQGLRAVAPSIDTMLANELGREQLLPAVSFRFPSAYVGTNLDRRVVPLAVEDIDVIGRMVFRANVVDSDGERDKVTVLLSQEAADLAKRSTYADVLNGFDVQLQSLRRLLGGSMDIFNTSGLQKAQPSLNYRGQLAGAPATNAAFALEALKHNIVRCVSFACGGFDTHGPNYRRHALDLQELFDLVAAMIRVLDTTPHPTRSGAKLSEHAHILVISEFCRTPQINRGMGRDHYPNNSALVISPRFKTNFVFGKTDPDQLLPAPAKRFTDGERAIAPSDLLATFLAAFAIDPRKYMRDGEIVRELLKA